jgi:hypothetical protein
MSENTFLLFLKSFAIKIFLVLRKEKLFLRQKLEQECLFVHRKDNSSLRFVLCATFIGKTRSSWPLKKIDFQNANFKKLPKIHKLPTHVSIEANSNKTFKRL